MSPCLCHCACDAVRGMSNGRAITVTMTTRGPGVTGELTKCESGASVSISSSSIVVPQRTTVGTRLLDDDDDFLYNFVSTLILRCIIVLNY